MRVYLVHTDLVPSAQFTVWAVNTCCKMHAEHWLSAVIVPHDVHVLQVIPHKFGRWLRFGWLRLPTLIPYLGAMLLVGNDAWDKPKSWQQFIDIVLYLLRQFDTTRARFCPFCFFNFWGRRDVIFVPPQTTQPYAFLVDVTVTCFDGFDTNCRNIYQGDNWSSSIQIERSYRHIKISYIESGVALAGISYCDELLISVIHFHSLVE